MTESSVEVVSAGEARQVAAHASAATRVTFFEDRAEVVRAARVEVTAGVGWVGVAGVSPFVDDRSVQARVAAGERARVTAAKVVRRVHAEAALGREAIDELEREAREARDRAARAQEAIERAQRDRGRAEALVAQWGAALASSPRGAHEAAQLAAWREAYEAADAAARRALAGAAAARAELAWAQAAREQAERRLALGRVEHARHEAVIEVQLDATEDHDVEVELTYRVPCALWRPEHLARLALSEDDERRGVIELVTWATAWQRTGERWDDVDVCFSTARPARAATPPPVADDVLASRRKSDWERRTVHVEARDQSIQVAGLGRGARAVDEMPGVDDGGEPLVLRPASRLSIPSDGRPLRVEVARVSLPADVARVLFPERAPVAHLRATATLSRGGPILAGPVRVARGGSLVGRAKIDYVAKGEPFELGFGADDGVRVRRTSADERDTVPVVGTQKLKRTVKVFVSNLSGESKRVAVTERVPVSEIEDVEVQVLEAGAWRLDAKDGFARAEVELPARATRSLVLVYEVRAGARVAMPF